MGFEADSRSRNALECVEFRTPHICQRKANMGRLPAEVKRGTAVATIFGGFFVLRLISAGLGF